MGDEPMTKELCEAKTNAIREDIAELKKSVNLLFNRLNWFYVLLIGVLVTRLIECAMPLK